MSEIHSIRLHGPWNARVMECFESSGPVSEREHRVKIPSDWSDWLGVGFRGRVSYERTFGRPTQLEPEQKVWLVVEETDFRARVCLNEVPVGMLQLGSAPLRVEIQHLLQLSNRLNIAVELPLNAERGLRDPLSGGLIGGVRIEIEES